MTSVICAVCAAAIASAVCLMAQTQSDFQQDFDVAIRRIGNTYAYFDLKATRWSELPSLYAADLMDVKTRDGFIALLERVVEWPRRRSGQAQSLHSIQFASGFRLRPIAEEAPEKYESYVDLEPGVWTKYRIEVEGRTARLCVHGATQPCQIVDDLKLDPRGGGVALWVGPGTEGYFSNLKVTAK
jgi:hypothetical protein